MAAVFDIALCVAPARYSDVPAIPRRHACVSYQGISSIVMALVVLINLTGVRIHSCARVRRRTMACSSFFQTAEPDEGLGAGPEAYCVTASLSVQYKAPLTPIPGVFRMDIVKDHIDGKRITVKGELIAVGVPDTRNGTPDTVMALGEAVGSNVNAPRTPRL